MPVLVLHMTGRGLDLGLIGLAFTVRALLVVILELPTGGLADAIGRRPVALASQLFTLASFLLLLFVTGPLTALAYAVLQGIGSALHSGALDAWYVDELHERDPDVLLQPHLAVVDVAQAGGMLIGSAVGGLLPSLTAGLDLPWPLAGFGISLFVGVALRAVVWVLTLFIMKEPRRSVADRGSNAGASDGPTAGSRARLAGFGAVPEILADALRLTRSSPRILWLMVAAGAGGLAMVSLETFWQPIAATVFGSTAADSRPFAVLGTTTGVAVLCGSLAVMRWGQGFPGGSAALAGFSMLVRGGAMLLFATTASATGLGFGLAIAYFALATNNVPHDTLLHKAVPSARRSSMLSVHSLVFYLGIALASGPLGWLAAQLDPRVALMVAGLVTILACVPYAIIGRLPAPPRATAATGGGASGAAFVSSHEPAEAHAER
jgi:MFS family permease